MAGIVKASVDLEWESVSCPVCGDSRGDPVHREGSFCMVRCPACRFIYLNPRPTEEALFQFYQKYLPEESVSIESWKKMMEPVFQRSIRIIKEHKKRGKLLDVGTGFGFFPAEMRKEGWEAEGVEISQSGLTYGREVLKVTVHSGVLEKIHFPENEFDVITAFYVIEHLPSPMAFLKECHRILKPQGLLLLRYPHTTPIKNLLASLKIRNQLYDLPAHLSDFSPKMIQSCLERTGFTQCQHRMGGHTLHEGFGERWVTACLGGLAEVLFFLSRGAILLPGVSKTVVAFKETPSPRVENRGDG